jgi:hypothetical protein
MGEGAPQKEASVCAAFVFFFFEAFFLFFFFFPVVGRLLL